MGSMHDVNAIVRTTTSPTCCPEQAPYYSPSSIMAIGSAHAGQTPPSPGVPAVGPCSPTVAGCNAPARRETCSNGFREQHACRCCGPIEAGARDGRRTYSAGLARSAPGGRRASFCRSPARGSLPPERLCAHSDLPGRIHGGLRRAGPTV
jgi:hypothetical protein